MSGSLLVDNIGELVTNVASTGDGSPLGLHHDAAVLVEEGRVAWVGPARHAPAADRRIDAEGAAALPGFVDSHAHLVFAEDRAAEFAARMAGRPYTGGGIRTTVGTTRAASDDTLRATVRRLVGEATRQGTTTIEIKSGYGLTVTDETRSLRIAAEFSEETTFLGAHVVPAEYADRPDNYVELICGPMLAAAAPHARWIDVFCERGAFDVDHARNILACGQAVGLGARVHANQLGPGPGVRLGVELGAASVDHCTHLTDADVDALASTRIGCLCHEGGHTATVATLLPGAEFSTRSPYPDARRLLDAGVTVALATDCNPGSSYTSSMPFCIALAVREMRMTPAEAVWAATAGGARALRRDDVGVLRPGSRADLSILDAPSHLHLAYRPGVPLIRQVLHNGVPQCRP
ncbi:imidazolonepropionase [Micromonospora sp. RTGN7]|uniref:imidazolonepropionase n=1 Tax=Micromonospora sp. RTGN7 TaxID=3016526 RepID=UPI0029FEDD1D|nr:imidazolonepropionase [Micromonospora sp. RTGN7]